MKLPELEPLALLLRLARTRADEARVRTTEAARQAAACLAALRAFDAHALEQEKAATRSALTASDWAAWITGARQRRHSLTEDLQAAEAAENEAREALRECAARVTSLELALDEANRLHRRAVARKAEAQVEDMHVQRALAQTAAAAASPPV